jgi:tRNA 2-thiouridine synthesizing protein D
MTTLTYTILVQSAPFSKQASSTAYHFCNHLLRKGHRLLAVFFYGDAVHNASGLVNAPSDEPTIPAWQNLAQNYGFDLLMCSTAAQRRGILSAEVVEQLQSTQGNMDLKPNLATGFQYTSLSQLIMLAQQADRFISFN